jgi:chloramphenicol-sensitive protein RarD
VPSGNGNLNKCLKCRFPEYLEQNLQTSTREQFSNQTGYLVKQKPVRIGLSGKLRMTTESATSKTGVRDALLAYGAWGLFPLYWKMLESVPALSILFHRILWSWVFYTFYRGVLHRQWSIGVPKSWHTRGGLLLAATLLSINWFLYIWAVNNGHIVESSLGYFINPLVNVLLGVIVLKEVLNRDQKIAVLLAVIGVAVLTWEAGRLPWIALALAVTFSLYGLIRKQISISSVQGGQAESFLMFFVVLGLLWQQGMSVKPANLHDGILLVGAGVVTGLPLLWFVEAAKKLPYYVMGFFQYIAPSLQFLTGVLIFHEPMSGWKLAGFSLIWAGMGWLLFRTSMNYRAARKRVLQNPI